MRKQIAVILLSACIIFMIFSGCSKNDPEPQKILLQSGDYHRVFTDIFGDTHLMKQHVVLKFARDGAETDSFQIGISKAKRAQLHWIQSEKPEGISISGDRLTLTSSIYVSSKHKPERYVFRIVSEDELEFLAGESEDIYTGDRDLIELEDGMRFRIPKKGETVIDTMDTVLPKKNRND